MKMKGCTPRQPIVDLIRVTADRPYTSYAEALSRARCRRVVAARRACIVAVHHRWPDYSYPQLGRIFRRDHSTVMHCLRQSGDYVAELRLTRNKQIRAAEAVAKFLRKIGT